mmetsp:Transcript_18089/g.24217  ORF Transcript_18089/g.24217 Transcript_18089/m.24217 type:complete len:361 (-) Transcript_18089:2828-3910(-)
MQRSEPLISVVVELHFVPLLPVVERAADLHDLVTRAPIVQAESVRGALVHNAVELRGHDAPIVGLATRLRPNVHIIELVLTTLFRANHLVNNVDRLIIASIPLLEERLGCIHFAAIKVDFISESAELLQPSDTHLLTRHGRIEGVLAQSEVLLLVLERADRALNSKNKVFLLIAFKGVAAAYLAIPHELNHTVLKATSFESDNRGGSDEELMLHDTTRLEQTRHEPEVSAAIHQSAIGEEFFGGGPEAIRVALLQAPHSVRALGRIRVVHIAWATDQELHFVVIVRNDVLGDIQDQMDTLLLGDAPNEGEKGNRVVKIAIVEVLHLEGLLGSHVVWGALVQLANALGNRDTVWVRERALF